MQKLSGLFLIVLVVLALAVGYVYKVTRDLPSIQKIVKEGVSPSKFTQIFARDGSPIMSHGKFRHDNTSLNTVSPHFIDALLATEDRRFYIHHGIDPISIGRALVQNVSHHALREGASTLTQQLARNVFLSNERSMDRKIREAALAWQLEDQLSKEKILELYVNNIYFGEGAYGIEAASEIFFGKPPSALTIDEGALLAGMPQAPTAYNPFQNPADAKKRRNQVLANLVETGKLSKKDFEVYKKKPLRLNPNGADLANGDRAPYFNRFVVDQIEKHFDVDEQSFWQSGLKIYTTLDLRAQDLAVRSVREQSRTWGRTGKVQQAALLSIAPQTGAILAYVGGKDYSQSQFDRVSKAVRSPGSLFKVFTYTTAIDQGYDPKQVYLDEPIEFNGWRPVNYDKQHHGYMTLAKALATSNNVIAVKVLHEVGPEKAVEIAQRMGINSPLNPFLALTLGGSGVNLLEITSAFGVLANQGYRVEPYAVDKVTDMDGQVLYEHTQNSSQVLSRPTVDTMVRMLMGVIQKGTGQAANIGRPMAGKTGTSDDYRDAWFVGFTPSVVTGVWVGNDDNTTMPGMTGGALPARIWNVFMRGYVAEQLALNFNTENSKPLADTDFTSYDPKNISQTDLDNPLAKLQNKEGELQSDPSLPQNAEGPTTPPPTPSSGNGRIPLNPRGNETEDNSNSSGNERRDVPIAPPNPVAPQAPVPPSGNNRYGYHVIPLDPVNGNANSHRDPGVVIVKPN